MLLEYSEAAPSRAAARRSGDSRRARGHRSASRSSAPAPSRAARSCRRSAAGGARLVAVTSQGGLTAADASERFGFERTADGLDELLDGRTTSTRS